MDGAALRAVKMDARSIGRLIGGKALGGQHARNDTAETAATAAVGTVGRHFRVLAIADLQNDEAPVKWRN